MCLCGSHRLPPRSNLIVQGARAVTLYLLDVGEVRRCRPLLRSLQGQHSPPAHSSYYEGLQSGDASLSLWRFRATKLQAGLCSGCAPTYGTPPW